MKNTESLPDGQSRKTYAAITAAGGAPIVPAYLPVTTTANLLGVSRLTVYRRYHAGLFPGRKLGRSIQILRTFVDDLVAEINASNQIDVDEFAAEWIAAREGAA